MSDYASSSTLGQFKTHEGDYSIEEEIFKIIGGTLKEKEQKLRDTIDNQREEIDRLNNIINELEKILKEEVKELYNEENPVLLDETYIKYATERKMAYMYILDKLKALKENK